MSRGSVLNEKEEPHPHGLTGSKTMSNEKEEPQLHHLPAACL
jgi:hypothetical protein